jgi:glycosyltransferase involved in cell wall biosynthesis
VIPVYNEESAITKVVKETKKYCDQVVVVDDCSDDGTAEVVSNLGVEYRRHDVNKGQGASTRTGIIAALSLGADIIVTIDGDGQHDPSYIPLLLEHMTTADVVIGSRFLEPSTTPEYRKFGIKVLTWLYNIGSKQKLTDSLLCLRAFKSSILRSIEIEEDGFGFCPEMLIKIRKKGFVIKEVPISCTYHEDYKQNSTFSPVKLASILAYKILVWRIKIEY